MAAPSKLYHHVGLQSAPVLRNCFINQDEKDYQRFLLKNKSDGRIERKPGKANFSSHRITKLRYLM